MSPFEHISDCGFLSHGPVERLTVCNTRAMLVQHTRYACSIVPTSFASEVAFLGGEEGLQSGGTTCGDLRHLGLARCVAFRMCTCNMYEMCELSGTHTRGVLHRVGSRPS